MVRDTTNQEQHILHLFDRGDTSAMNVLYATYANYLTAVCARYIADDNDLKDVLPETFIRIFTQIHTFEFRGKGSLKAWLARIAVNESLTFLRNKIRERKMESFDDDPPDIIDETPPEVDKLSEQELLGLIRQLPIGYRTVFNLYAIEGKSHQEIGELLNIKADSSASQYHRAKNMLAKMANALTHKAKQQ